MDGRWYWKHRGDVIGPLSTDDLADLIRHRRVDDRDELRPSESLEWLTGDVVKSIFAGTHEPGERGAAANAADRLLQPHLSRGAGKPDETLPSKFSLGVQSIRQFVLGLAEYGNDVFSSVLTVCFKWCNRRTLVVVLFVLLVVISLKGFNPTLSENQQVYEEFSQALDELRTLHSTNAAPKEWQEFRENNEELLEDAMERLRRSDEQFNSRIFLSLFSFEEEDAESRYHLTQAGHRLRDLYGGSSIDSDRLMEAAEKHLNNAENVLCGDYLIQKKRRVIDKAIVLANREGRKLPQPAVVDPWLVGIVAINTLLWMMGGYFYWKWQK